ncbi:heat-inducible transcriptional repressor HrcA [Oscillatoria sp. FACHB-1406]|uniref:heat-inducible transcriptional repressor HrcA n=1 Tax=Oscillatoria sp. FACHB-1406 TaxID=2692846 RepID=UPI0016839001|nr:heat-inducible transcriptional repressor HrcA [Oscillatoria sp. FACHB-1406]MBD2580114.1 heat-inducible transcriptional repressor HrcA [Oscillatoria sp. FACHB-1406]
MTSEYELSERHQNVLRATVRHYVTTAEPVGSKTLTEEYGFRVSSATIRNVMGNLEKVGLLYQPHASAGRIPSDSGYRMYVDRLIAPNEQSRLQLQESYTQNLDWGSGNFELLLQRAAQILATLSGYIALITLPQNASQVLRHLQAVQIDARQVMLIVVTDSYQTQSMVMELSELAPEREDSDSIAQELQILSNFLNHHLRGRSLAAISSLDWSELDREFQRYAGVFGALLQEVARRSQQPASTTIVVRGISEALRQPEFSQVEQVQMLLQLLEKEQEQLLPSLFTIQKLDVADSKRTRVRIGAENALLPLNTCAVVAANYCQNDVPVGSVAAIGPTRMLYENAIALVEAAADYLSEVLSGKSRDR